MEKGIYKVLIYVGIGLLIIFLFVYLIAFKSLFEKEKQLKKECEKLGILDCKVGIVICFKDCQKLGLEYFRFDGNPTVFSNDECWCKVNNKTEQIW